MMVKGLSFSFNIEVSPDPSMERILVFPGFSDFTHETSLQAFCSSSAPCCSPHFLDEGVWSSCRRQKWNATGDDEGSGLCLPVLNQPLLTISSLKLTRLKADCYQQVPQKDYDCNFSNCRNIDACLVLDIRFKILSIVSLALERDILIGVHLTFSVEKLMQTAPSLRILVGSLNCSPGTPLMTTSLKGTQFSRLQPSFSITSCLCFLIPWPRLNCWTPVISTL